MVFKPCQRRVCQEGAGVQLPKSRLIQIAINLREVQGDPEKYKNSGPGLSTGQLEPSCPIREPACKDSSSGPASGTSYSIQMK
jgi:hypothetical protein